MFSLLMLFLACEPSEEMVDCTMDFRYSSTISLMDANGEPVADAAISYTVDGVEGEYVDSWMDGQYSVGGEEAGDFRVDIFVQIPFVDDPCCWDVGQIILEYTIEEDECHVIPQSFAPELEWSVMCADGVDSDGDGICG